ncbi:hypothetical protein F2Q68_00005033 [Brassica cretica]|uniref:Uncharacterized protein n=1 Tax=Brassica cretica TaxID=69181 RepID=A0A8S9JAL1_BRACR|nr:hypothetical protein F2Q68_00005033 [Brassica cretica]
MGLKGPEPVARIRAREGVAEVAEIVQQEAEIAELPQSATMDPNQTTGTTPSGVNDIDLIGPDSGAGVTPTGLTGANDATETAPTQ